MEDSAYFCTLAQRHSGAKPSPDSLFHFFTWWSAFHLLQILFVLVLSPCVLVLVVLHSRAAHPPFVGSVFLAVTLAHWAVARGCHGSPFGLRAGLPSPMAMWRCCCPPLVEPLLRAAPHLPPWCPEGHPPNRVDCPPLAHLSHADSASPASEVAAQGLAPHSPLSSLVCWSPALRIVLTFLFSHAASAPPPLGSLPAFLSCPPGSRL